MCPFIQKKHNPEVGSRYADAVMEGDGKVVGFVSYSTQTKFVQLLAVSSQCYSQGFYHMLKGRLSWVVEMLLNFALHRKMIRLRHFIGARDIVHLTRFLLKRYRHYLPIQNSLNIASMLS